MHQQQTALENIVGKGEITHNEQFLLFQQCFLLNQIIVSTFVHIFYIISLFAVKFKEPKIGISGEGLRNDSLIQYNANMDPNPSPNKYTHGPVITDHSSE